MGRCARRAAPPRRSGPADRGAIAADTPAIQARPGARVFAVVVVILGLAWATLSGALTGPPTYADPLTTSGWQNVGPGNFSVLSGAISGEDYIQGNYTVENPPGAP